MADVPVWRDTLDRELGGREDAARAGWRDLVLVGVGGAAGTFARYVLGALIPAEGALPLGTLVVNVAGAFLLGALTGVLVHSGVSDRRRRDLHLLLGTGLLGGFTTYSLLAGELTQLVLDGSWLLAALYASVTLVGGIVATWLGLAVGAARRRRT